MCFLDSPERLLEQPTHRLSLVRFDNDGLRLRLSAVNSQMGVPKEAYNDSETEEASARPTGLCQDRRQR